QAEKTTTETQIMVASWSSQKLTKKAEEAVVRKSRVQKLSLAKENGDGQMV
ncbi:22502_t:CDS:1, partial [Gigaspora rosea]